jgi:AraC-like DNA-binding protein
MTSAPPPLETFRERRPLAALADHVTCVWVQQVEPGSSPYTHRTVPNGSAELICVIGDTPRIVGPQVGPTQQVLAAGTTAVGVRLRPGAAPAALGLPAAALVGYNVSADEVWGASAVALAESLATARSPLQAAARLESEVLKRLRTGPNLDGLAAEIVRRLVADDVSAVGSLASALVVSERQFRRRCAAAIGLSPKVLQRMLRFQRFLALADKLERPSAHLAHLGAEAGYADQPHLTRESVRLDGRTPRALLLEAERHCKCGHDHTASYAPLRHTG